MSITVGQVARTEVTLYFTGDTPRDYITNTVYHAVVGKPAFASGDYQTLAQAMATLWANGNSSYSVPNWAGLNIVANTYDMADATPRPERGHATAGTGAASRGSYISANLCGVLSFYSGRNIPGSRGRLYLSPLQSTDCVMPLNVNTANSLLHLGHGIYAAAGPGTFEHVIWHPKTTKTATAGTYSPVTTYWVGNEFGQQHRRQQRSTSRVSLSPTS